MNNSNKVEEAVQNSSPDKMGVIMEGLNQVEELIKNHGIEEMDAIMDGLNKMEDLIEHDSPEEMDSLTDNTVEQKPDVNTNLEDNKMKLRRRNQGDASLETPTTNHDEILKQKHKKHHRPDPLDTPIRRFRKKYEEESFGLGSYGTKNHVIGICVLLGGNFTLFPLLFILKRRYIKGRLD